MPDFRRAVLESTYFRSIGARRFKYDANTSVALNDGPSRMHKVTASISFLALPRPGRRHFSRVDGYPQEEEKCFERLWL